MSSEEFLSSYTQIEDLHLLIFETIELAVRFEESEEPLNAIQKYKEAMSKIDETLALQISVPDDMDSVRTKWEKACKIIHKLKRTRSELLQRVGVLIAKHKPGKSIAEEDSSSDNEPPSTKVKCTSSIEEEGELGRSRTYSELATELKNLKKSETNEASNLQLIFTCNDVRFYKIKPDGTVMTNDGSCTLRILRLEKDEVKKLNTTFFIQIIRSVSFFF